MTGSLVRALIVSAALSLSLAIPADAALVLGQHQQVIETLRLGSAIGRSEILPGSPHID